MSVLAPRALAWRTADVVDSEPMTARARRIRLRVDGWPGADAGQHVDVRLTGEDGYQATRSYSLASVGDGPVIELLVARVDGGEVSEFLNDELRPGDRMEVLGPLGRWFVWTPSADSPPRPVVLIAGGAGIVPIVSILRARHAAGAADPFRLLASVRSPDDVLFPADLALAAREGVEVTVAFTRAAPDGVRVGRIDRARVDAIAGDPAARPLVYVCGTTSFVEAVLTWLAERGHADADLRAERFGG